MADDAAVCADASPVQAKEYDAALVFPPDFAQRLEAYPQGDSHDRRS